MSSPLFSDSSEVLKFIKDTDVKFIDIRFTDLPGIQQHLTIPASTVDEDFFTVGHTCQWKPLHHFEVTHTSIVSAVTKNNRYARK